MPVLLIAGGSRGIGAATARLAAAAGYDVAVNYKSNAKAADTVVAAVKAAGRKAVAVKGDMALEADIERTFDEAAKALGPITHFVHSAGIIGENSRLDEADAATIREVLDIDTFGALICLRECVRRMSTRHGGKGGSVVMLSSMAAPLGGANECVWYAAAKGGIDSAVIGVAREVAKEGMRVNADHARRDRHRHPAARPARTGGADAADGPAGAGGRGGARHPVPAVGRSLLHQRREFAGVGGKVRRPVVARIERSEIRDC